MLDECVVLRSRVTLLRHDRHRITRTKGNTADRAIRAGFRSSAIGKNRRNSLKQNRQNFIILKIVKIGGAAAPLKKAAPVRRSHRLCPAAASCAWPASVLASSALDPPTYPRRFPSPLAGGAP